jgi:CBS domain-containing protein
MRDRLASYLHHNAVFRFVLSVRSGETGMRVSDVMTANVYSVAPDVSVDDARTLMRRRRIHHLVVNNARGDWVGIVSAQDLERRPARHTRRLLKVADVMTRHVLTIEEQATVDRASFMMRGRSIGCLLVLRAGQVIGIITTSDLLRQIGRGVARRRRATTDTAIHHRVVHRRRARADGVW